MSLIGLGKSFDELMQRVDDVSGKLVDDDAAGDAQSDGGPA